MHPIFNPDYLQHLCRQYGLKPSKKYGQNFLIDPEPIEAAIAAGEISKTDTVVEVGPGFGVLTQALAEQAGHVIAFEIEKQLRPYWEKEIKKYGNLEIVWGNVLHRWRNLSLSLSSAEERRRFLPTSAEEGTGGAVSLGYKVISNLPYQITSPVIRLFLECETPPERLVLLMQKEVAERICAQAGQMSLLAVSVQYYADAEIILQVPRSCFWPVPAVDSAIILIKSRQHGVRDRAEDELFFKVVKAGFAQKRKFLVKNLEPVVGKQNKGKLIDVFTQLGIPAQARAQELSVEQWLELTKKIEEIVRI